MKRFVKLIFQKFHKSEFYLRKKNAKKKNRETLFTFKLNSADLLSF